MTVVRDGFDYRYTLPASWDAPPLQPVCDLMRQLSPLLVDMTGLLVIRKLLAIAELRACIRDAAGDEL